MHSLLVSAVGLIFPVAGLCLLALMFWCLRETNSDEAAELNLRVHGDRIVAYPGTVLTGHIAPTTAAGTTAPVTDIAWAVNPPIYQCRPFHSQVELTALLGGCAWLTVSAVTAEGRYLIESRPLPDVYA